MTGRFANQAVGARLPGAKRPGMPSSGLGISALLPILLHAPLALLMRAEPGAATAHAVITGVVGLAVAQSANSMKRVAHLASYVMGADVLWRMTGAGVFYEYSKYATVAILGLALGEARSPGCAEGPDALLPATAAVFASDTERT